MEDWSEGQLALFDVLGKVCDTVGPQHAAELTNSINRQKRRKYLQELNDLRKKSGNVDNLRSENDRLKLQLDQALQQLQDISKVQPDGNEYQRSMSATSDSDLKKRYDSLVAKYNKVFTNLKDTESARKEIEAKLRKDRVKMAKWIELSRSLMKTNEKQVAKLAELGVLFIGGVPVKSPMGPPEAIASSPVKIISGSFDHRKNTPVLKSPQACDFEGDTLIGSPESIPKVSEVPNMRGLQKVVAESHMVESPHLPHLKNGPECDKTYQIQIRSSQCHHSSSTQGEPEESPQEKKAHIFKVESPTDIPVVVSSRSIRKRVIGANSPGKATIKAEPLASSPLPASSYLNYYDSIDLDDIGEKIDTPKKRRRLMELSTGDPPANITFQIPSLDKQTPIDRRSSGRKSALQLVSPNKILPRTSGNNRAARNRRDEERVQGANLFSEDGENYIPPGCAEHEKLPAPGQKSYPPEHNEVNRRLTGLLDHPSPQRMSLGSSRRRMPLAEQRNALSRSTVNGMGTKSFTESSKTSRFLPQNDAMTKYVSFSTSKQHSRSREGSIEYGRINPDDEPFRARPLKSLGLEHFKINQEFNNGYDYAYSDVVRGREQRRCLPGCTKLECCGDTFRKIAESLMTDDTPTISQEEKEEMLLSEFMGGKYGQLRDMTKDQRKEILLQAKTREIANQSGRHRHAYGRRKSPPGFWRADFPTTQEVEVDRVEAKERERTLVQERYEEAMRDGGRWVFKDE